MRVSRVEIVESTLVHPDSGRRSLATFNMSYPKSSVQDDRRSAVERKLTEEVDRLQTENTDLRRRLGAALAGFAEQS